LWQISRQLAFLLSSRIPRIVRICENTCTRGAAHHLRRSCGAEHAYKAFRLVVVALPPWLAMVSLLGFREPATPLVHIRWLPAAWPLAPYRQLSRSGDGEPVDPQVKMPATTKRRAADDVGGEVDDVEGVAISPLDAQQQTPIIDRLG
jgi:hypothetical protein